VRRGGCFLPPQESASPPEIAASIVQGKGYSLSRELASAYFGDLIQQMLGHTVKIDLAGPRNRQGPVFGDPRLAPQRLGQQAFKAKVLVAYGKLRALHHAGDRMSW
jgi:putative restriction endonuclease